jgi:hypothetical protein
MGAQVGASLELLLQNVVPHHHKDKLKGQVPQSHHLKLEIFWLSKILVMTYNLGCWEYNFTTNYFVFMTQKICFKVLDFEFFLFFSVPQI